MRPSLFPGQGVLRSNLHRSPGTWTDHIPPLDGQIPECTGIFVLI